MFLQASVILSTGGGVCLSACWDASPPRDQRPTPQPGRHPPGPETPPDQAYTPHLHPSGPETPPDQADPPGNRDPPTRQIPPRDQRPPPPRKADASIRSMSGRYASYWNAFLFR